MTVENNTSRNQYTATGGQSIFAYTFEVVETSDMAVLQNGTRLTNGVDYTVSGAGDDNGGNVTLTSGAISGDIITLYRDMPYDRTQDYQNNGPFLASEVNTDFDRLWLASEQTERGFTQAVRKPITDNDSANMELPDVATRAGKVLAFDIDGSVDLVNRTATPIDVQEGEWTPVLTDTAAAGGTPATYELIDARYVKVASLVSVSFRAYQIETTGMSPTGQVTITGLPFSASNEPNAPNVADTFVGSCVWLGIDAPETNGGYVATVVQPTSAVQRYINFRTSTTSGISNEFLTWADINEFSQVYLQVNYFTNQ